MTFPADLPFIGRKTELAFFLQMLEEAAGGHGRLAVVAGEAGMGKTRLMEEIAVVAQAQGHRILWSQMSEDPGAPPYFPWKLALRDLARQLDDAALVADLGSGAADVADILPELRDRLNLGSGPIARNTRGGRHQLFDALSRFLHNAARRTPAVVLLDNLHLADPSSLALLEYVSQQLSGQRLLVVGAYRDSHLERRHPLRLALNRLSGFSGFEQLVLGGLSNREVAELLHAHLNAPAPAPVCATVHGQSGGNPLFVNEVGAMLARRLPDEPLPVARFHFSVPQSLRAVIQARLESLPDAACRFLGIAAVLGRKFDVNLLSRLSGARPESVDANLQPAEAAGVIGSSAPGRFRFRHVLYREVLYAEHTTLARVKLHRKAGELLEKRHRNDLHTCLPALAYHFFEAAQAGSEHKAVDYCRQAADSAISHRAYDEAAVMLERALQALALAKEPQPETRFELLLSMGRSQYHAGQLTSASQTLAKCAVQGYRQGWWERLADALILLQIVCQQSGMPHVASVPLHRITLKKLPAAKAETRARLLASLANAFRTAGEPERALESFRSSVTLARDLKAGEVLLDCLRKGAWTIGRNPMHVREGLDISREALALATQHGRPEAALDAMTDIGFQLCDLGEMAELQRHLKTFRAQVLMERQPHFVNVLIGFETAVEILQGNWREAHRLARESVSQAPVQGVPGLRGRYAFQMFIMHKLQGTLGSVAGLAERILATGGRHDFWLPGQILLHCELNQLEAARGALNSLGDLRQLPDDDLRLIALVYLAEACVRLRDLPRCELLYELLQPYRGLNATLPGTLMLGAVSEYLAMLATAMRRYSRARELIQEAMDMNAAMGAGPALAATQVSCARLLVRSENEAHRVQARHLLGAAAKTAARLELRPVLAAIEALDASVGADLLTARELGVLRLVAGGCTNKKIADALHISAATVATHVRNILRKTGAANRTEAAEIARRDRLFDEL